MWNCAVMFESKDIKKAVMQYIDCRFDILIDEKFLQNLGFAELHEILSRNEICIKSEKAICDAILAKLSQSNQNDEATLVLSRKLFQTFPQMSLTYVINSFKSLNLPIENVNYEESSWKRNCQNCFFVATWLKDESEIRGIRQYLEERKQHQYFIAWEFDKKSNFKTIKEEDHRKWKELSCMQIGQSFYQHYGPIKAKNGQMLAGDKFLFYLGGGKLSNNRNRSSINDNFMSDEAYCFELSTCTWLRLTNHMPLRLFEFGAVYQGSHLYLIGGLTDNFKNVPGSTESTTFRQFDTTSRKLVISRQIYRINEDDWFNSASKWHEVTQLPKYRTNFSVVGVDSKTICIVGYDFCDIFDTETEEWISLELESHRSHLNGHERPIVASVGNKVFIVSSKCSDHASNAMWTIDLSENQPCWQPWLPPSENLRFDPIMAFTHNSCVYLMGKQVERGNFCYKFDPCTVQWQLLYDNFGGTFLPHTGVLLNRRLVEKNFFNQSQPIEYKYGGM